MIISNAQAYNYCSCHTESNSVFKAHTWTALKGLIWRKQFFSPLCSMNKDYLFKFSFKEKKVLKIYPRIAAVSAGWTQIHISNICERIRKFRKWVMMWISSLKVKLDLSLQLFKCQLHIVTKYPSTLYRIYFA